MDRNASYLYLWYGDDNRLARQEYQLWDYDFCDGSKLPRLDIFVSNDLHHDVCCHLQIRLSDKVGRAHARLEHNFADHSDYRTRFMDMLLALSRRPLRCALFRCWFVRARSQFPNRWRHFFHLHLGELYDNCFCDLQGSKGLTGRRDHSWRYGYQVRRGKWYISWNDEWK